MSRPSLARSALAAGAIAACAVFTVAVKVGRDQPHAPAAAWLVGVLPNFVCAAVAPLILFLPLRAVRGRDYLAFVAVMAVGLVAYEFTQLVMPRRTFDRDDITATAAGAVVAAVIGGAVFLLSRGGRGPR